MYGKKKIQISYLISAECAKESYGIECNETCGHCRAENQCSHINLTCLNECEVGFKGVVCKTGKENIQVQCTDRETKSF